jgi:hypothetical protein
MKKSIKSIQEFVNAVDVYKEKFPDDEKFNSVINALYPRLNPFFKQYHQACADIKLGLANTDKNGSLLYNPTSGGKEFAFTKEGYCKLQKQLADLLVDERFEFEPIYIDGGMEHFPAEVVTYFEGFIIEPTEEEE